MINNVSEGTGQSKYSNYNTTPVCICIYVYVYVSQQRSRMTDAYPLRRLKKTRIHLVYVLIQGLLDL